MKSSKLISLLFYLLLLLPVLAESQQTVSLNKHWQFFYAAKQQWYPATVPGTIHTDLLSNQLIPDPFYRDNEASLQWIDDADWQYKYRFDAGETIYAMDHITLQFDGLDTYATVYLNGQKILEADNMFRDWKVEIKQLLRRKDNQLRIEFASAKRITDSIAKARLPLVLPDNNRVHARKAQFQFGWDWGPKFISCGIWKNIYIKAWNGEKKEIIPTAKSWNVKLVRNSDSIGTSFYFEKDGKPVYAKGANWIPANIFLPGVSHADYRNLLLLAKNANMNMLRVWGGGIYEDDYFYDLCDSLGIMVWQDLMFAGGMYPGDARFLNNVREEIKYQVQRLRRHPCIVLWCGNNEIDEAWHNWGWQEQFNLHGADSAQIWNDYKKLFEDSLAKWINEYDGLRPYVPTSPMHGWGHKESFTEGDSHYWGLWWGLEDWEQFKTKTGRFVSEYGMQSMPNWNSLVGYTTATDRYRYSPVLQSHQKAGDGFKKLDHYLTRYFLDSVSLNKLSLSDYSYLTQCLQYYILKNSIATHRGKYPQNMGTLLWQLNDCWPVTSWSISDYSRQPKAAWYAVREAYRDDISPVADSVFPKNLSLKKVNINTFLKGNTLIISADEDAKYVELSVDGNTALFSDNYFDLVKGKEKTITVPGILIKNGDISKLKIRTLYGVLHP